MNTINETAPAFVEMAHRIVWASVATVDTQGRPRSRILHPIWQWDGSELHGWVATGPTPIKRAHLQHSPYLSINYWSPSHDTCVAECQASWVDDLDTKTAIWNLFATAPALVGYDPKIVPVWTSLSAPAFGVLRLKAWRLRVFPGAVLMGQGGKVLTWQG